jgi:hypothetical protein
MTPNFVEWIWHVRGSLKLAPGQSSDDAFDRLDPLFRQYGTRHERHGDTLTFRKKDQAAQDRMSVFDGGVLKVERASAGSVLRYHLTSRALLYCFLAPLLFIAIAQMTLVLGKFQTPPADKASAADAKHKAADQDVVVQNPIDKALGAPAPEKPKKGEDKPEGRHKKPSPTTAYVFAAMFAILYVVGRFLESWLVRSAFEKHLRRS